MFNWLKKNNKKLSSEPEIELASIKYFIVQDENLHCEVEVNVFNELSANCFGKLLLLLEHGEIMGLTIETLQMLSETNREGATQFVDQALTHWQTESNRLIKPVIRPTEVFKEK